MSEIQAIRSTRTFSVMTRFEGQRTMIRFRHRHELGSQICTSIRRRRICGRGRAVRLCVLLDFAWPNRKCRFIPCPVSPLHWCYGARQCWHSWRTRRVVHHQRCQCSLLRGGGCRAGSLQKANLSHYHFFDPQTLRLLFACRARLVSSRKHVCYFVGAHAK